MLIDVVAYEGYQKWYKPKNSFKIEQNVKKILEIYKYENSA